MGFMVRFILGALVLILFDNHWPITEAASNSTASPHENATDTSDNRTTPTDNSRSQAAKSIDIEKYISKEFHNENNVYTHEVSTDTEKYISDDYDYHHGSRVANSSTPDYKFSNDYYNSELTTPKTPIFDSRYQHAVANFDRELSEFEGDSSSSESTETHHNYTLDQLIEKTRDNGSQSKLDYVDFRNIVVNDTEVKNARHQDHVVEAGTNLDFETSYNDTKIIDDGPNKTRVAEDDNSIKKNVDKPESDHGTSILSNKIENESNKGVKSYRVEVTTVASNVTKRGSVKYLDSNSGKEQTVQENQIVPIRVEPPETTTLLDLEPTTVVDQTTTTTTTTTVNLETTTEDTLTTTLNSETTTTTPTTTPQSIVTTWMPSTTETATTIISVVTTINEYATTVAEDPTTTATEDTTTTTSPTTQSAELGSRTAKDITFNSDHMTEETLLATEQSPETTTTAPVTEELATTDSTTEPVQRSHNDLNTTTTEVTELETLRPDNSYLGTLGEDGNSSTTPSDAAGHVNNPPADDDNAGTIAAIAISTIGAVCLILLAGLLFVMRKRQKRFNYGQRCRPVGLDDYSMDNVSVYNSVRRKGLALRASKRSYGNPAFEDPSSVSHPLNLSALTKFAANPDDMASEFEEIPQITARTNELPEGCDTKNRYANVIPLPETRVYLNQIDGRANSDYINANYVSGPKNAKRHYIACQAPMQTTVEDFWRMVWEQQCKLILMVTHLYENGIEKCVDYLPPSEVLDCHRLFGDFQVTLRKREVKDKYVISTLQLKNMVSNSWREITHFWYIGWPEKGIPTEANSIIAFLIEARSYMKSSTLERKIDSETTLSNGNASSSSSQSETGPVVVHCSPGTGRTGVLIACDIAIRDFEQNRLVDVPTIVYKLRRDRAGSVQTKDQYAFIYKVINVYATKLTGGALDSL